MIRTFGDKVTEDVYHGRPNARVRRLDAGLVRALARKLDMIEAASRLDDLRSPPGNQLEALKGDLKGYYSIRVNDQWRVIFRWSDGGAEGVQIVDYHS